MTMRITISIIKLFIILIILLQVINLIMHPYPIEMTSLGIKPEVDHDAVLVAFSLNMISFLLIVIVWTKFGGLGKKLRILLFILTFLNVLCLIYWARFF
jgi:hypothetical protein